MPSRFKKKTRPELAKHTTAGGKHGITFLCTKGIAAIFDKIPFVPTTPLRTAAPGPKMEGLQAVASRSIVIGLFDALYT